MNASEFLIRFKREIEMSHVSFVLNMENLGVKDKDFCEWVDIFIRWSELANKEDCEYFYMQGEKKDGN